MAGKSYKQLYEETRGMLDKYQDEIVPKLREQTQPLSELEILALKAVAHGCNTNQKLFSAVFMDSATTEKISFLNALTIVYALIERLTPDDSK